MVHATSDLTSQGAQIGNTSFDATDRLAIVNVLNSYGYFVDELRMDDYFSLFTDSATVEMWFGERQIVESQAQFKHLATSRQEFFAREKIQRRHVLSAPRFERQSGNTASGQTYFRLYKIHHNVTSLVATGYYEFSAVKNNERWQLDRWIGRLDSLPDSPGEPLGK